MLCNIFPILYFLTPKIRRLKHDSIFKMAVSWDFEDMQNFRHTCQNYFCFIFHFYHKQYNSSTFFVAKIIETRAKKFFSSRNSTKFILCLTTVFLVSAPEQELSQESQAAFACRPKQQTVGCYLNAGACEHVKGKFYQNGSLDGAAEQQWASSAIPATASHNSFLPLSTG